MELARFAGPGAARNDEIASLGLSIFATWNYLNTGRSVLALVLFHYTVNLAMSVTGVPLTALISLLIYSPSAASA